MTSRIYFDHNATTPLCEAARVAMASVLGENFGNPSSVHDAGRRARTEVERARTEVAQLLGARPEEMVFTSGGTEANLLGIVGAARAQVHLGAVPYVVSSRLEHPAVHGALDLLAREGFEIARVEVDRQGRLDLEDVRKAIHPGTALVTLALANHELGNVYPLAEVARLGHAQGALVHTDMVQAAGKIPIDVTTLGVDLASLSGHKIYGPKGIGALYVRRGTPWESVFPGGHQERERRPGTENVPGIVGLGAACEQIRGRLPEESRRIRALRDHLEAGTAALGASRFGNPDERVPGTSNLGFEGASGELVMMNLDLAGVSVSTGAACSSGSLEPSPVLLALGLSGPEARSAVRFGLGLGNTVEEVERTLALLPDILERVRAHATGSA